MTAFYRLVLYVLFLVGRATWAHAEAICDFDGDGRSEIALVNLNSQRKYDWTAFNPRTEKSKAIISSFGDNSSKLIPGSWFEKGRAVAAIVDPVTGGPKGRATWIGRSVDYAGGAAVLRSLGRSSDIIVHGGDYDGNGITDSLILKKTTGKLGLRVNYFLSTYDGDNLGKERLYRALGSPFKDLNFFFSPDGNRDYLAVLRRSAGKSTVLQLKPFTDAPLAFSVGPLPGGVTTPLPVRQGSGKPDLLAFYAARKNGTQLIVKTVRGVTVFSRLVAGTGTVTVGDYSSDPGWEIAVQNGNSFTMVNPRTKSEHSVQGPSGKVVSCISNQKIN